MHEAEACRWMCRCAVCACLLHSNVLTYRSAASLCAEVAPAQRVHRRRVLDPAAMDAHLLMRHSAPVRPFPFLPYATFLHSLLLELRGFPAPAAAQEGQAVAPAARAWSSLIPRSFSVHTHTKGDVSFRKSSLWVVSFLAFLINWQSYFRSANRRSDDELQVTMMSVSAYCTR